MELGGFGPTAAIYNFTITMREHNAEESLFYTGIPKDSHLLSIQG